MKFFANAKINLSLDVVRKREDGYHDVNMIMQSLKLCDEISIEKKESGIILSGNDERLPYDEKNLAYKSAELFFKESGIFGGADIYIKKVIPLSAGLAGGSSDAAATLASLNEIYGKPFDTKTLLKIGSKIGADVPYCILKGTAIASGIGEKLTPISPLKETNIVLVKPEIGISTPWAYKNLELAKVKHPDIYAAAECIKNGNYNELYGICSNVFESVVFKHFPIVAKIKDEMRSCGADLALMSGSGPTVFGIFENENTAKKAYSVFKSKFKEVFLTKSTNV